MEEKQKLYMRFAEPISDKPEYQRGFYASNSPETGMGVGCNHLYFANGKLEGSYPTYYKSLKGLAVAIRKAGFIGIDQTKSEN